MPDQRPLLLAAVGNIRLSGGYREVAPKAEAQGPFENVKPLLAQADIRTAMALKVPSPGSPMPGQERPVKLHILAVAKHPLGGIRTYFKYTYGQFDAAKYRFTIAAIRFPQGSLIPRDLAGFEVELRESEGEDGNRGLLRLTREALHRSHVDVIHSQGLTAGLVAILANWRSRRPHVITHHDVFRADQFPGVWGWLKRRLMAMALSRADLIVCVSEDSRENFTDFLSWFPAEKLMVVLNGIETGPFAEIAERRRRYAAGAHQPDSPFTFAFLGRFMPQKGFDILTEAVAELASSGAARPFRVLAVNSGDLLGRYKREIKRRGLEAFFQYAGFTSSVTEVLAEVHAVVFPSRWEAGPLVPMEVLAAGCPLIASDCVGLREVVRGTPALVVRTGDPHSLAQCMKMAMERQAELRTEFCDFASVAQERFDVHPRAATMEQILSRLADSRKGRDFSKTQAGRATRWHSSRRDSGREGPPAS